MTIPIRDTKQQVFYVQMVTPVYEMDPQQRIQYLKYKEIKYQNTKGKKKGIFFESTKSTLKLHQKTTIASFGQL